MNLHNQLVLVTFGRCLDYTIIELFHMAAHIMLAIARELKRSISGTYADTNRFLSWIFAIFEF